MKNQFHLSKGHRKEQIIREILYLSESGVEPTIELICNQINMVLSNSVRKVINELVYDLLINKVRQINPKGGIICYYYPNHTNIKIIMGNEWYTNVMRGIIRRLNK